MKYHSTTKIVERYDDLDMAWLYHAEGWHYISRIAGHHSYWSWMAVKLEPDKQRKKKRKNHNHK